MLAASECSSRCGSDNHTVEGRRFYPIRTQQKPTIDIDRNVVISPIVTRFDLAAWLLLNGQGMDRGGQCRLAQRFDARGKGHIASFSKELHFNRDLEKNSKLVTVWPAFIRDGLFVVANIEPESLCRAHQGNQ
jgi:hypothetical protein